MSSLMEGLFVAVNEGRTAKPLDVVGQTTLVKVGGAETGGAFAVFHLSAPPMSGPPLHRHSREDELFYVLGGELQFEVAGTMTKASAGTTVYLPRGTAHAFQNFTASVVNLLIMVAPAGLERLFEEMSATMEGGKPADLTLLAGLNAAHGVEFLGSPLS
jgi:quercetin dioxygenase-like cupin family protein